MSCKACEEFQRDRTGSFPYRWKNATVELLACRTHAKEIFDVLNSAQTPNPTKEDAS